MANVLTVIGNVLLCILYVLIWALVAVLLFSLGYGIYLGSTRRAIYYSSKGDMILTMFITAVLTLGLIFIGIGVGKPDEGLLIAGIVITLIGAAGGTMVFVQVFKQNPWLGPWQNTFLALSKMVLSFLALLQIMYLIDSIVRVFKGNKGADISSVIINILLFMAGQALLKHLTNAEEVMAKRGAYQAQVVAQQ